MNGVVSKQLFGPRTQLVRVALVILQPLLEDFMDRDALPASGVVVVDRIFLAKAGRSPSFAIE
jgi:hypothetical protein